MTLTILFFEILCRILLNTQFVLKLLPYFAFFIISILLSSNAAVVMPTVTITLCI